MKKQTFLSEEEMNEQREQITEEIGEDVMKKLSKAMNVLAAAMFKRADYRAKLQSQKAQSGRSQSPEESA